MKTETTKENIVLHSLNKAKLGYIMNTIFKIIRILTLILYLIINITMVYLIYTNTEYYSITEKTTALFTLRLFSYTLFVPIILFLILFLKKDNMVLKVIKIIIQFILLIISPYVFIVGTYISLSMPSYTTNPADYASKEIYVDYLFENEAFTMLPDKLPDNITDVDYLYKFEGTFDNNNLTLEISWTYQEDKDYQNAKLKMQSFETINNQVLEDGFNMMYAIGNSNDDNQRFCFGYNDSTKSVTYRIYYEWVG